MIQGGDCVLNENISPEQYISEIKALNKKLNIAEQQIMDSAFIDKRNPFENPTEYRHYNSDYGKVEPEIEKPFFKLPLEPEYPERRNIRRFYNVTGLQMIFHVVASEILMYLLTFIIMTFLQYLNPDREYSEIADYFYATVSAPANMLIFLICNVTFACIGLKMTKTSPASLVRTCDFTLFKAVGYLFIVLFLNEFSSVIVSFISYVMSQCGFKMYNINDYTNFESTNAKVSEFMYSVLVAPVTEEFFYRGMVLKNFSKASQRCGIFLSALLFGLMHTTVPQIVLGFTMGIFLAHITLKHNSIIPAIIAHSFNNSLGYILNPVGNITSETGIIIANSVYYACVMLGLFALVGFKLTNKLPHDTPHQSRRGISLALTSIPVLIVIVYYIIKTISYILRIS